MRTVIAWLRQPTTIGGLSGLVAAISALVTGQLTGAQALPIIAGALVSMALPDNTAARQTAEAIVKSLAAQPGSPPPATP